MKKPQATKSVPKFESNTVIHPPVNLVVPNTSREKMEAIVNLAKAVLELAKAVNGVHLKATISNNVISGAHTGIHIENAGYGNE